MGRGGKCPAGRRPAIARVGDEDHPFRGEPLKDRFHLPHGQAGRVEVVGIGVVRDKILLEPVLIGAVGVALGRAVSCVIDDHRVHLARVAPEISP